MQRVISVSLNRNVYHFEEDAHARLTEYLDRAQQRLAAAEHEVKPPRAGQLGQHLLGGSRIEA